MHITLIIGSHRKGSQSAKVGAVIEQKIQASGATTSFIDLAHQPVPYRDNEHNPKTDIGKELWKPYQEQLARADGIVIVTPEWNGTVPGGLKNFFHWCMHGELAYKLGLLVGVSSGMGGAYPIAELRMGSYKNTKICYMPDHLIIREAESLLNGEPTESDTRIQKRIDTTLQIFYVYVDAFHAIRDAEIIKQNPMPHGM